MERLKITAMSLSITILVFLLGPLVLSALLYYGFTYCESRLKKETEIKHIPSLYVYAFFALPFIIFYLSKQLGFQKELFEILRFIFSFKIIEMYDFNYDGRYLDKLVLFSIAHLFSILTVFMFSFYFSRILMGNDMEFPDRDKKVVTENKITEGKRMFGVVFLFFVLLGVVVIYYFSFKGAVLAESKFYREGLLNVVFFPGYIILNIAFFSVVKYKPFTD